jgi:hypothetical protein
MQLLLLLETQLSKHNHPQSFTQARSFGLSATAYKPAQSNIPSSDAASSGAKATFHIKVIFRQNTSWQGTIIWSEGRQEKPFRSVLELLLLIDSALSLPRASQIEDALQLSS